MIVITRVIIFDNELWWGGAIHHGIKMPLNKKSEYKINLSNHHAGNQAVPFFISNKGRYIWSENPFTIEFKSGEITIDLDESELVVGGNLGNLRDTYLYAMNKHFPFRGAVPESAFYAKPQYNSWVELIYNQNQEAILKYARDIIKNGYITGILTIDDTWQTNYGVWTFNFERFPDPKSMVDQLHKLGFKVMLWVCPYISPDSAEFREAMADPARLIRNPDGSPVILKWWNGYSGALDMTSPNDIKWLQSKLDYLVENFSIDGFKFDGGSVENYNENYVTYKKATPVEMTIAWNDFAQSYPFHELKDTWKAGGKPINQRLRDKDHRWEADGLACILPDAFVMSLTGHPFVCPDMVGGGEHTHFMEGAEFDQELIVRFAQCSALFPMLQFSVAPWRILSEENARIVREVQKLHFDMGEEIYSLVKTAAKTGEPIIRPLAYEYPDCNYENITDQFMLGSNILVAPVVTKNTFARKVVFPTGIWQAPDGEIFNGNAVVEVASPIESLPWFRKLK